MWTAAIALLFGLGAAAGQPPPPAFEVASIKPNNSGSGNRSSHSSKGQIRIENYSLRRLIQMAYDVRDFSFSGPSWLDTVHFDILAKLPPDAPPGDLKFMMQTLMTERFQVAVHREKKTMSGYALLVAKKGLKVEAVEDSKHTGSSTGRGRMEVNGASMAQFAEILAIELDRPVQDLTGVPGIFNLKLLWTPDDDKAADGPTAPTFFTALQEQLGLRLESQKVTLEILVVDRAERLATEN